MSAWKCDCCEGGTAWQDRDGKVSSSQCYWCKGTGSGWAPDAIITCVLLALCAAYAYVCNGCHV